MTQNIADGYQVRVAGPSDGEDLARLRAQMDAEEDTNEPPGFRRSFVEWFAHYGQRFTVFVGETTDAPDGRSLVGTLWLERVERIPRPSEPEPGPVGYLTFFYVEPNHRNRGLGATLLGALRRWARAEGYETLIVWPSDRSVPLYRRHGFDAPHELLEHSPVQQ